MLGVTENSGDATDTGGNALGGTGAVPAGATPAGTTPADATANTGPAATADATRSAPGPEPAPESGPAPGATERERLRNLRVSDAEREHVVELLQRAIGHGMLNLDEFTERTDTTLGAQTRGELNAVLTDLPGLRHEDAVPAPGTAGAAMSGSAVGGQQLPGERPVSGRRVEIKGVGSTLVRRGRWQVPPEMLVRNKYGETKLDFSSAEFTSGTVHVDLDTKWGSVNLIVPEQASVDLNGLDELKWSSLTDKTDSTRATGTPRIVVTGRVIGGSMTVRYSRRNWFG
ncbi:protein of unknown function (DUF1707) [Prauserella halophila]|nr:protein of unknown function (DUF1707) [Prauserella halophila]